MHLYVRDIFESQQNAPYSKMIFFSLNLLLQNRQEQHLSTLVFETFNRCNFWIFWSVFSRIWTENGDLQSKSPYSAQIRENTDQKIRENTDQMFGRVLNAPLFNRIYRFNCICNSVPNIFVMCNKDLLNWIQLLKLQGLFSANLKI